MRTISTDNFKFPLSTSPPHWGNLEGYFWETRIDRRNAVAWNTPFTFSGKERDGESGYSHFGARYYDSDLGIWISVDPQAGRYPNLTPYNYCVNNPVMCVDPNGEWVHLVIGAVIGGVMNLMLNANNINSFWQGVGYFGVGAFSGALGAGVGAGISSSIAVAGSFGAGFMGTSAAVSTTGFAAGTVTGAIAGIPSGFVLNAGNSWLGGSSFGQGLANRFKGGVMGGIMGRAIGGLTGGIDAAMRGRNFWTGSYKQYDLQVNHIASADNDMMFEEYSVPDNATVANLDKYNVYYKPEGGVYGIDRVIKPGKHIISPVDGVATSKYTDMVYKVPGKLRSQPQVRVLPGGEVGLCMGSKYTDIVLALQMWKNPNYIYGWMPLSQLDSSWETLFKMASIIK